MASMCDWCKDTIYLDSESGDYKCENGCACCNDPSYSPLDDFTTEELLEEVSRRRNGGDA